jgi:hypothetical protein
MPPPIVVGASWCHYSRQQADEIAELLETGALDSKDVSMCMEDGNYTTPNNITFTMCTFEPDVKQYPTWRVEGEADQPGYKTKNQIMELVK